MKNKKLILFICIFLVIIAGGGIGVTALLFNHPFNVSKPTFIYIDENDNTDSVLVKLETQLNASTLTGFKMLIRLNGYTVRTGAYRLAAEQNTLTAYRLLSHGRQTPVKLIVPSVRTIGQLSRTVARQIMADSASISTLLTDSLYCDSLGYTRETIASLFLPNTYEVYWNMTAQGFIARMQKEYARFWDKNRRAKASEIGLTPTEVSTLASIVEEETANRSEKPTIAGLYLNRLRIGMPLQADPTVKFALQDFGLKRILYKHLETESAYNTYKHPGLPPGPIRIPSIEGIESVLNYAPHNYLYMCAKEDFSGTHNFAATLAEHQVNARRYQAALNRMR